MRLNFVISEEMLAMQTKVCFFFLVRVFIAVCILCHGRQHVSNPLFFQKTTVMSRESGLMVDLTLNFIYLFLFWVWF